jgi:SAM-dependent methyltransferase
MESIAAARSPEYGISSKMYEGRTYCAAGNAELIDLVCPSSSGVFLDVGCGGGGTAKALRLRYKHAYLVGLTISKAEYQIAKEYFDEVHIADIQHGAFEPHRRFDGIIFSHVLEHLVNPVDVLSLVRNWLTPEGFVYIALPNIAFYRQRLSSLLGHFDYTDGGLMDRTHLRFYTYDTARVLLESAGFCPEARGATGIVPAGPIRRLVPGLCRRVDKQGTRLFPNLFGWQILVRARPTP